MVGSTVQHYLVRERLGAGGMGEVYRAEDVRLGRPVALKFLTPSLQADPESRQRLMNEARAASGLRSPHIAVTYDMGEHEGSIFIVMEYVEGELISTRIGRGPLPVRDGVAVALQVADALDEAHGRGIVHRDIKSANLISTPRGIVKVLDFGLAKFVVRRPDVAATLARQTAAGIVLGTVAYMSPEQALGREVDHRSDLFSLGVVLYEMLAGRVPFDGASVTEVVDQILHADPAPPSRLNREVPETLDALVRRALVKDVGGRYQTARQMYEDLQQFGQALEAAERGNARTPPGRRLVEPAVAVMTFSNITGEPADDWIGSGIAETVTGDLKNIRGLAVIGRALIFDALKNLSGGATALDDRVAIDVARRLGAAWVVVGGYQRRGSLIRITAQFVNVADGALIKTVKVDGQIDQIFDLQDQIVFELSQGLNLTLGLTEMAGIERDETRSVEAYESYSRGMMNLRMATRDSIERAIALFERALEHDPQYAAAWAALGGAYDLKGSFLSLPELVQKAVEYERRALAINPRMTAARVWLGTAFYDMGHADEAIVELSEAIRLEPGNASAHSALARAYWVGKGRIDEGITELEHAVQLNPEAGYPYLQLGLLYAWRGRFDQAEAACRRAVDLQERYLSGAEGLQVVGAHARLGYVFYLQGRYDEAVAEYERELAFLGSSDHALRERSTIELYQKLGAARLRQGRPDDAARYFDLAIRAFDSRVGKGADDPFTRYYMACLYALRGDRDRAIDYLHRSFVHLRALNTFRVSVDPDLESVRDAV
jgi:tetratricopeptide (TPR) repeat protein